MPTGVPASLTLATTSTLSLVATSAVKGSNEWVNRLLSDWQVAPLVHASSGQPLNIIVGKDNSLTLLNNDRPNQVLADYSATNPICNNGTTACVQFLNPAAFTAECARHVRQSRTQCVARSPHGELRHGSQPDLQVQ